LRTPGGRGDAVRGTSDDGIGAAFDRTRFGVVVSAVAVAGPHGSVDRRRFRVMRRRIRVVQLGQVDLAQQQCPQAEPLLGLHVFL